MSFINREAGRGAWCRSALPVAVAMLLSATTAWPQGMKLKADVRVELQANGNASASYTLKFPPQAYQAVKSRTSANDFLTSMARGDMELRNGVAGYDDSTSSLVMTATMLGAAKNLGMGRWEMELEEEPGVESTFFNQAVEQARPTVNFTVSGVIGERPFLGDPGVPMEGREVVRLPAAARNVTWNPETRKIRYDLAYTGIGRTGRLEIQLKAKDKIMTGCYKVYADKHAAPGQWVAKAILTNVGDGPVRDLKVRYKVDNHSEWSITERFPEVLPGQAVVSVYHPVLDKSVAALRTTTPTNVRVEYTYTDGTGKEIREEDGKPLQLLGVNEFNLLTRSGDEVEGANTDLLAAWVFRDDPVITHFAGLAAKRAGGSNPVDVASTMKSLQAIYELMVANDITYQHPGAGFERGIRSFDVKVTQNLKFPRDVLRYKSGTCIDLAILYASTAQAMGIEAALVLVPGHAFPVFRLPTRQIVAVESTGVGGGSREGGMGVSSFEQALKHGMEVDLKRAASESSHVVDFKAQWAKGVSNPELEALPPDILERWGFSERGTRPGPGASSAQTSQSQHAPEPGQAADFSGNWVGKATEKTAQGSLTYEVNAVVQRSGSGYQATFGGRTKLNTPQGPVDVLINGDGVQAEVGAMQGTPTLKLIVKQMIMTMLATGAREPREGNTYFLQLANGRLVGRDEAGAVQVELERR